MATSILTLSETYVQRVQNIWPQTGRGTEISCFSFPNLISNISYTATTGSASMSANISIASLFGQTFNVAAPIKYYVTANAPGLGNVVVITSSNVATFNSLVKGVSYNFYVFPTTATANSIPTYTSNTLAAVYTLPGIPIIGTATAVAGSVCVSFTANADTGGNVITYTATSNTGVSANNTVSPITVGGLATCTPYTFTVRAFNSVGYSFSSAISNSVCIPPDASTGIFQLSQPGGLTTRNKYTFSSDTNGSATAASTATYGQSAAGYYVSAIFRTGLCFSSTTDKYTYSGDVVAPASAMTPGNSQNMAVGNSTRGIFHQGYTSPFNVGQVCRTKYTYATDVTTAGANAAGAGACAGSAAGTCAIGIFHQGNYKPSGCLPFGASTRRCKYTYSTDTNAAGTSACVASFRGTATGNSTRGIFSAGNAPAISSTREKYIYSGDTQSTATAASASSRGGAATGNSTRGIFAHGFSLPAGLSITRDKYTYSNDSQVAAAAASVCSQVGASAASNGVPGVNR